MEIKTSNRQFGLFFLKQAFVTIFGMLLTLQSDLKMIIIIDSPTARLMLLLLTAPDKLYISTATCLTEA